MFRKSILTIAALLAVFTAVSAVSIASASVSFAGGHRFGGHHF